MNSEITALLEETKKYDFPFLSSEKKKLALIEQKKIYIDSRIIEIFSVSSSDIDRIQEDIWKEAKEKAMEQFNTLPDKVKLNGFYLQELMHTYVELLVNALNG